MAAHYNGSKLAQALALARRGFHVFPLKERSKVPAIEGYPEKATTDPDQITRWWTDPVMETELDRNIGISTSAFTWCATDPYTEERHCKEMALLVVDVDNKNGKTGDRTLQQLEMLGDEFPPTLTFQTPTGGRHLVYMVEKPVNQRKPGFLGDGIDIRSRGGYIVAPGSVVEAGEYIEGVTTCK